jgi:hypothetical protein
MARLMIYAIFAWTVFSIFIAIPTFAFTSFLYVVVTSHVATRSARAIIRRDEEAQRFDALNSRDTSHAARPSQSRMLRTYLTKCAPGYRSYSDALFSFNSDGLEIYLELSSTSDGFATLSMRSTFAQKVGLTSRIKNFHFEGLNANQEIRIANERYNFGDLLLVESGYFDNLDLNEFQSRIICFQIATETCRNQLRLPETNKLAVPSR